MEGSTRESWETQREENRACGALRHFCDGDFMGHIEIDPRRGDYYIGRNQHCDIEIPDSTVSYRHLRIYAIDYACGGPDFPSPSVQPLVFAEDMSLNGTYLHRARDMADPAIPGSIKKISLTDGAILLNHGDRLYVSPQEYFEFNAVESEKWPLSGLRVWLAQEHDRNQFQDHYVVSRRLVGVGGHSKVHLGYRKSDDGQIACKIIRLNESLSNKMASLLWSSKAYERLVYHVPEVEFLKDLQHPNIVAIERIFYNDTTAYIFQELIPAGDLLTYIVNSDKGRLDDAETASIIRQVLKAIAFMHSKQIVHRDLKPDNIMMTSLNAGTRVVVADFGQAKRVEEIPDHDKPQSPQRLKRLFSVAGSFPYRAPEIERREADGYSGKAADMWTIGIIAAVTLSGDGTFGLDDVSQEALPAGDTIMKNAARANLRKSEKAISWRTVGPRPKDFIKKLVTPDVEQRLTAEQALQHCWFTNSHHAQFFEDLYKFGVVDRWKQRPLEDPLMVQLQQSMVPGPPQCGDFLSMRPDPHDQQEDDHDTVAGLQQPSVSKTMRNPRCEETDSQCLKPVEQNAKLPLKVRYELPELPSWSQKHAMRPSKRDGTTSHFFPKAVH